MEYTKIVTIFTLCLVLFACGGGGGGSSAPDVNIAPSISGAPANHITVGENYRFAPTFSDPNSDTLTFSIINKPSWAEFDVATGILSGTADQLGITENISISVSDGEFTTSLPAFSLRVHEIENSTISIRISGASNLYDFDVVLNEDEANEQVLSIQGNGDYSFEEQVNYKQPYAVDIKRHPARQECEVVDGSGIASGPVPIIKINCDADESAELFDINVLHKYRITMTADEWNAFVLDTERARYDNRDSENDARDNLWTHSEIYRKVDVERVDATTGEVLDQFDNVGFKMRGNNSRQWPEYWVRYNSDTKPDEGQPNRFHFSLKFSEKFNDDEGVYACIDASGNPAAVSGAPCWKRVSLDHPEIPENDDRTLKGIEKLNFKFNKDDPTYARELLSHDILTQIGAPTSRMAYAAIEIVITGEAGQKLFNKLLPQTHKMGIYMVEEPIDKLYLQRYFGKNGYLFKVGGADLTDTVNPNCLPYENDDKAITGYVNENFCRIGIEKSDPSSRQEWLGIDNYLNPDFVNSDINDGGEVSQFAPYRPNYDLKEKKGSITEARIALQDFMLFLQSNPTADELNEQFDVLGFIKAQAADIVTGAVDHYTRVGNNYYLYLNPLNDKWTYLVYDYDFSFRDRHPDYWGNSTNFQNIADTRIFPNGITPAWNEGTSSWIDPILWTIVFSKEENKTILYQEIKSLLNNQLNWEGNLKHVLNTRNNLIKATILDASISIKGKCDTDYNETALGLSEHNPCDNGDISIKEYVEWRQRVLGEELDAAGI
ncbi:MAG: hypothetical protein ACJA1I_000472 [Zhongshania marina]|jgi:hypothetical protein